MIRRAKSIRLTRRRVSTDVRDRESKAIGERNLVDVPREVSSARRNLAGDDVPREGKLCPFPSPPAPSSSFFFSSVSELG